MEFTDPKLQEAYEKNKNLIDSVGTDETKKIWVAALAGYDKATIKQMIPELSGGIVSMRLGRLNKILHPEQYANRVRKKSKRKIQDDEIQSIKKVGGSMKDDDIGINDLSDLDSDIFDEEKTESADSPEEIVDEVAKYAKVKDKLQLAKIIVLLKQKLKKSKRSDDTKTDESGDDIDFGIDDNFFKTMDKFQAKAYKRQMQAKMYQRLFDVAMPGENKQRDSSDVDEFKKMMVDRFEKLEKKSELEKALEPFAKEIASLKSQYTTQNNPELMKVLEKLQDKLNQPKEDKTQELKNWILLMNELNKGKDEKGTDWKAILQMRQQDDDRNKLLLEKSVRMDSERQDERMDLLKQSMDLRLQQMEHEFSRMVDDHKKPQGTDISEWIKQYKAIQDLSNTVKGEPPSTFDRALESLGPALAPTLEAVLKSRQSQQPSVNLSNEEINMVNALRMQEIEKIQKQQHQPQQYQQPQYQPSQHLMPEEPMEQTYTPQQTTEPVKKKKYLVENL